MRLLVVGVMLAGLQVSHQTEYPGPATIGGLNRWYTGNGGYTNNCPIATCDTTVCPIGKYLSGCGGTSAGDCDSGCSDLGKPSNSVWSTNGGTSATGCSWVCDVNFELDAAKTGCIQKTCAANNKLAIDNSAFLDGNAGASPNCKYQCNAGYMGVGTSSDLRGPVSCNICQAGTAAAAGATSCFECGPGLYSASAGSSACSICDPNYLKYSLGARNTGCSDCTLCAAAGSFKNSCGGASAGGCDPCTNSRYTPP